MAAAGDTDSFAALYQRHHRSLYRYCRSIVADPDDAADALQNTMARALAAIGDRDEAAPVRAWLFRIAHNESISLARRRRGFEPLAADTLIARDVEADAERRQRLAQLVSDLQELTERQRGMLLMHELNGLRHAEIAAAFGTSEGAVKQSIFEARTALHDFAAGREMTCTAVRRQLSDGDGRTARSRRLRSHLRVCAACRQFRDELAARRSELAAIAPVLPAATAAAVLEGVIGGGSAGGGGLLAGLLGGSGFSKTVAVGAATVTVGAGAATFTAVAPDRQDPPASPPAAAAAGGGGGGKTPAGAAALAPVADVSDDHAPGPERRETERPAPVERERGAAARRRAERDNGERERRRREDDDDPQPRGRDDDRERGEDDDDGERDDGDRRREEPDDDDRDSSSRGADAEDDDGDSSGPGADAEDDDGDSSGPGGAGADDDDRDSSHRDDDRAVPTPADVSDDDEPDDDDAGTPNPNASPGYVPEQAPRSGPSLGGAD